MQEIVDRYKSSEKLASILRNSGNSKARIHLSGLSGSSDAFVAAALYQMMQGNMLFILRDREEAAYFQNNLENILNNKPVLFFPSSYKKPFDINLLDNNNVLQRAEVLSRISKSDNGFPVVTYSEAISEKVVTQPALARNTIEARIGENVSIDFITEFLIENEFERTDFVLEAGQFAVRGGIIDIYSYAYELPYRLEFSGDSIISIRSFDPSSQLSETNLNHITIIPNVQTRLLKEGKESFFDFIPSSTLVWLKDTNFTFDLLNEAWEKTIPFLSSENSSSHSPKDNFDKPEEFLGKIELFRLIEFGNKNFFSGSSAVDFKITPQPSFNKNFNLFASDLLHNLKKDYTNLLFADNARQVERLYAIFEDLVLPDKPAGKSIDFTPVMIAIHEGFIDHDLKLACYTDHQVFNRYHRYRLKKNYSRSEAITLKELYSLKPGDFVTHIDHGIGRFGGLEKIDVNGKTQEAIRLIYKDNDILYVSIHSLHRIARYAGKEGAAPSLNKLGSNAWASLKQKTKKRVKDIARELIELYAKRKTQKGFSFMQDTYLQNELEASFIYEDTPDQLKATRDVKKDMESISPMDRLICGDVGFGKTEIAIRAAFKSVTDGKQVAMLVPTTILALQHYRTFKERLKEFPCTVDYINRFKSSAQQNETLKKLEEGKIDIIIGTHRLLSKDVKYKDLGLLIIDEEQKFGVAAKEKIRALRVNIDTLTLTATPIPRTLQFSLMGARDLSIINTAPPNRFPVTTEVHTFNEKIIKEAIEYEVSRGGQVFFVHNRVKDIQDIADFIKKVCPGVKTAVGHGQMDGEKLEEIMMDFIEGDTEVLISTTIIESGLDISNANTIIINQAQNFGLSDLHQMRGRVGRSNKKAFCYLLAPPPTVLTPEARQRLKAIEEFSELGMGFQVSMRDLDIRGAGNLLGGEQSGFISDIGFEMYQKILDEAIQELKETDFKGLFAIEDQHQFVSDCQIDTDLEILIPSDYVSNIVERLNLYKEIDDIETEEKIVTFEDNLRDRFGPLPLQVKELLNTVRLRWKAKSLGFEKIILKNKFLKCHFISNPESSFYSSGVFTQVLQFIKNNGKRCKLKETESRLSVTFNDVETIEGANKIFSEIIATTVSESSKIKSVT